jgi:glyoxylase I family protein
MTNVAAQERPSGTAAKMPTRLHHYAFTTYDMERTRQFYEEVIGMPLAQTWIEAREGPDGRSEYCHCFFRLQDGGALAFFEYSGREPQSYPEPQPQFHIALRCDAETQRGIRERLLAHGYREDAVRLVDHGYCVSLYATDPNGLPLEFTVDHPHIDEIVARQAKAAHDELARWRSGDRTTNNSLRPDEH